MLDLLPNQSNCGLSYFRFPRFSLISPNNHSKITHFVKDRRLNPGLHYLYSLLEEVKHKNTLGHKYSILSSPLVPNLLLNFGNILMN